MSNPAIVVCMDASGSMSQLNYFKPAQTDAATFISIMQTGDSLGVTGFSDNAWIAYPSSSSSVAQITSQSVLDAAAKAVMSMKTANMTNMSAALSTSAGMLSGASTPKAIVLLSDGMWNAGSNPLNNLPSMPVHTIALGNNGQVSVLQQIASGTSGSFHLAPTPFDLQDVYNEIIGQAQIATVVANQKRSIAQNRFWTLPATISAGSNVATFAVSWSSWAVTYTSGTPVGNQVNVSLQDPSGAVVSATPTAIGNGFVVFKIPNPASGTWNVAIWTSASGTLGTSGGAFDPQVSTQMKVQAPMIATVGKSVPLAIQIRDVDGSIVPDACISAHVEMPSMNPEQAVKAHRIALDAVRPHSDDGASDNARMLALQYERGPVDLLLPYEHVPLGVTRNKDGTNQLAFTPKYGGGHIVRLQANGYSPARKSNFSLSRRISIWSAHD